MNPQAAVLTRSRLTLILLGSLFFAPFIGAWVIYNFFPNLRPTGTTNYGELIVPAKPIPALELKAADGAPANVLPSEKWTLLQVGAADCDAACNERLVLTRQVRLALGKNLSRLQRVYIAPDAAAQAALVASLGDSHKNLHIVADAGAAGSRARDVFGTDDPLNLYLIDPNGNWLLVYKGTVEAKGLLGDLKKLMKLSNIG